MRTHLKVALMSRLSILPVAALIIMGCAPNQPHKSWQRTAAEKAYAELDGAKDDARRGAIRDYIKALLSLEKGGDPDRQFAHGRTLLMMAVIRRDAEIVQRSVSLDVYADVDRGDDDGNTPLIVACKSANADIARMLLRAGAKVNVQNKDGMSALMACAQNGDKMTAGALLISGADPYQKDAEGYRVGDYATRGNHGDVTSFIINFQTK